MNTLTRRHDVDWLRNLAFMLLILYHIGMYYVADWGWHIKSDSQSVFLQNLMILSNQWRMSLLFFVSGMTLALVASKYSSWRLFKTRFMRLFIPLLAGMYLIVPPQLYFELVANIGLTDTYWQFWLQYIDLDTQLAPDKQSAIGLLTWNHLWYLSYLFTYTLVFIALRPLLNTLVTANWFARLPVYAWVAIFVCSLLCVWYTLRPLFPVTHALLDDWYSHGKYFTVFVLGYLFVHRSDLWSLVIKRRNLLLFIALCTYSFITLDRNGFFPWIAQTYPNSDLLRLAYGVVLVVNLWGWLLAAVGFAGHYLNRPSRLLDYANQAVLPCYILHQTLIILFAVALSTWDLSAPVEAALLVFLTLFGCLLGYEIVRRFNILKLLFGIKIQNDQTSRRPLAVTQ